MDSEEVGDIMFLSGAGWQIYGPDPWAWDVCSFNCWFSAKEYYKENGEYPPYVSDTDRTTLGL